MTPTSDDCPKSGGSSGGGNSSSRTTDIGIADHDEAKAEKENKEEEVPICVASSSNTLNEKPQNSVPVVGKVSEAEESANILLVKEKENSGTPAGTVSATNNIANRNVTSDTPVTNTLIGATESGSSTTGNGVVGEMNISDDAVPATHTFSKVPMCAICSEPCICYCKSCKKVSYCGKEHQRKHWKEHRPECYPVTIQVNSVFGSHLVVTRDIKRGEVILHENPLVAAPYLGHNLTTSSSSGQTISNEREDKGKDISLPKYSICLSCHKIMWEESTTLPTSSSSDSPSRSTCSRCGWPICCSECEKHPIHADQECKIFAEYHVEPSALCDKDAQYLCVALLRILQHKKELDATSSTSASNKWSRFMEDVVNKQMPMKDGLNSQLAEAKKATARFSDLIRKSLGSIIYSAFSVTDAEIDQIVRALRTSSFITDNDGYYINGFSGFSSNNNSNLGHDLCDSTSLRKISRSSSNSGKFLTVYHLASMLTSNCVPNASWVIQQPCLDFYLRASTPIKTGERITITFVDPLLGTRERRELLWKEKYLLCSCTRCSDPSESCTFFSAIKCPGKKVGSEQATAPTKNGSDAAGVICECEGYLLPTDPLAVTYTSWHSPSFCCCSAAQVAAQEVVLRNHGEEDTPLPGEKLCEERTAEWKCNVCLMRQPSGFVQNSLERMKKMFLDELWQENVCFTRKFGSNGDACNANKVVLGESKQDENTKSSQRQVCKDLEILEARVDKIDSLVGNVAHSNHYYILKMEKEILSIISELLEKGQVPFEEMEKWAVRVIELCKKGLKVVNVLCPGLSRERGQLLYFLQQGLTISLLFKTSRAMRNAINSTADIMSSSKSVNHSSKEVLSHEELMKKFYEVILARKEILEIFALTKDNSKEREMLRAVQQDSIEIRLLKNYFKSHQNIFVYKE